MTFSDFLSYLTFPCVREPLGDPVLPLSSHSDNAFWRRLYHTTLTTRQRGICLCDLKKRVSKLTMGQWDRRGSSRLTKDVSGMSLLGEGLQLVVAPAVLSVAVPRVLHHLQGN